MSSANSSTSEKLTTENTEKKRKRKDKSSVDSVSCVERKQPPGGVSYLSIL